eukprot:4578-Heterococcus_DN1.PRE.3
MQYTIWDACWDPFLRRILVAFERTMRDKLADALWNDRCTTVESAKTLTMTSPALQIIPDYRSSQRRFVNSSCKQLMALRFYVSYTALSTGKAAMMMMYDARC